MKYRFKQETREIQQVDQEFKAKRLIIDHSYQRRSVWLLKDKVRLIETILAEYVIPEVYFWIAERDSDTGIPITHIVDGQQRICAIIEFLNNEYSLKREYLTREDIVSRFADKKFSDLSKDDKTTIWEYPLSIVFIDSGCSKEQIRDMFFRLNMTEYNLNAPERLKSLGTKFGEASELLSQEDFWSDMKVFSLKDIKRMIDTYYCSTIYILASEGIVDQTSDEKTEKYYSDYADSFDEEKRLYNMIEEAMSFIKGLKNKDNSNFIRRKVHLYTLFSLAFKYIRNGESVPTTFTDRFNKFVTAYNKFKNKRDHAIEDKELANLFSDLKRYKLASSEGVNKSSNRVIRLEVLEKICLSKDEKTDSLLCKLCDALDNFEDEEGALGEDSEDSEDEK